VTINIRAARPTDFKGVLELWQRTGIRSSVADDMKTLKRRYLRDRDLFLVASRGGQIVGSLIAGWDGWRGSMARLAVDPACRRERIAKRLVERAEARLRKRGAKRIGALVFVDNTLAQTFWRAAGYVEEPTVARFVKNL
jgi:ribosomal protein S18 acetylase RimI-like enzyme